MKKHQAPQFELLIPQEPFALIQEQAPDFERLQAEDARREQDRKESQSKNLDLFQ